VPSCEDANIVVMKETPDASNPVLELDLLLYILL
jgi:hypothetical protein